MQWDKGFSSMYILRTVNQTTWADEDEFNLIEGSIDSDFDSELYASASIKLNEMIEGEKIVRVYLCASQDGAFIKTPLFTGIATSPERRIDGPTNTYTLECYSLLKFAKDVIVPIGYYVPANSGAEFVKGLLSVGNCKVVIDGQYQRVSEAIVAEDGDSYLSLALKVLKAINCRIRITGDGVIHICDKAVEPIITFGVNQNDVLETSVTDTYDLYSCPNCFMAVSDDGIAVAKDENPESKLSIKARGREVWVRESGVNLTNAESIAQYAIRRLKEEQDLNRIISYTRRFFDGIVSGDAIRLNYPEHELVGDFRIKSQKLTLGYGCSINEEVFSV